jgi:hypothetical protein
LQRSSDLRAWSDHQTVVFGMEPITLPIATGEGSEFFRLKQP